MGRFYLLFTVSSVPRTSLVAQTVKRLPTMWEACIRSLGWEDPLEKEMATHGSTLAWKIPWTEELGRLQSMGLQRVRHDWGTKLFIFLFLHGCISIGMGSIFQATVLEWVAISFSRGSSQTRDRTLVSCIAGRFFTIQPSVTEYMSLNRMLVFLIL